MSLDVSDDHNKEFAVVCFCNGEYSEVPSSWLVKKEGTDDSYQCWWPDDDKSILNQIKQKAEVNESCWTLHDITLDKFCSSYTTARKRAQNATFESAEERTTAVGKGHRQKFARNLSHLSNDDIQHRAKRTKTRSADFVNTSESEEELILPPFPQDFDKNNKENQPTEIISTVEKAGTSGTSCNSDLRKISGREDNNTRQAICNSDGELSSDVTNKGILEALNKMSRTWASVELQQKNIISRLDKLEKKNFTPSLHDLEIVNAFLPLKKKNDVQELNEKVKEDEFKSLFVTYILQIGGNSSKDTVYNILSKIMKDKCARKYTWKGQNKNDKPAAVNLLFIKCIRENVCAAVNNFTQADFNAHAAEWFRVANQRYKREKEKKNKSLQAEDEDPVQA